MELAPSTPEGIKLASSRQQNETSLQHLGGNKNKLPAALESYIASNS